MLNVYWVFAMCCPLVCAADALAKRAAPISPQRQAAVVRLNGGSKPPATVGSQVQVVVSGGAAGGSPASGQVVSGSANVLIN